MSAKLAFHWIQSKIIASLMPIEEASFDNPWTLKEFKRIYTQKPILGIAVEHDRKWVAFTVFKNGTRKVELLNFAVHPDYRRMGIGSRLLSEVVLLAGERQIFGIVSEYSTPAHLWLKANGFRATKVERNAYDVCDASAYYFSHKPIKTKAARMPAGS